MAHRFIPETDAAAPPPNPEFTTAIKRWAAELLRLGPDATVTVAELRCRDEGCPLVETTVTVFNDDGTRTWAFTRPKVALTKLMVQQTLATLPRCTGG